MNERIRQLAKQADKTVKSQYLNDDINVGVARMITVFAELIIAECIELFPERHYHYSGLAVKRNIKKHFGVEE